VCEGNAFALYTAYVQGYAQRMPLQCTVSGMQTGPRGCWRRDVPRATCVSVFAPAFASRHWVFLPGHRPVSTDLSLWTIETTLRRDNAAVGWIKYPGALGRVVGIAAVEITQRMVVLA